MHTKSAIGLVGICSAVLWGIAYLIMAQTSPSDLPAIGIIGLFLVLFLALLGTITALGTGLREKLKPFDDVSVHLSQSIRQATLLSALVIIALLLSHAQMLHPWSMIGLIVLFCILELFFLRSPARFGDN